jgi:protein-disulfide isomerase-like protein with CxxC motif
MSPNALLSWLLSFPYPGAVVAMQGAELTITLDGEVLHFDGAWRARDGQRILCTLPDVPNADDIHAEIRRGLAIARGITGASWRETTADCVGSDLPGDPPPTARTCDESGLLVPAPADAKRRPNSGGVRVLTEPFDYDEHRAKDLWATRIPPDQETVIANEAVLGDIAALMGMKPTGIAWRADLTQSIKRLVDAHAVVSQRLVGAQKEVAEVSAERDEAIARAAKVEGRLRRDDELREQIAVAVGLDGSASLALILDTVRRDAPDDSRAAQALRALVGYHQAPITFADRPLTLAERASFVIRRLWQGRTNAAAEAAALRRELGDIEAALGDIPDTAEREPIGDREDHLGLSTAERLRLHLAGQS